ncbi:hypothetical protein DM01DRAFT_1406138 [Hesseltinella vesiculosa]|uniref:Zn(2)-C6 fungal-type domain-containing protein n=1 Tax=Hesseltinella vesiculosa TaxID=101127 RepID=A0A1X2GN53_9FUNG|nr:hypothetical protein DM01DRAFT_1406138 [Hesseltinella vesiculosa]
MQTDNDLFDYNGKTGKKRERATQACLPCRKKKKRCDGLKPECRNCQEAEIPCEYAIGKRRGPRKGYVQLLEDRLAMLESRLANTPSQPSPKHSPSHESDDIENLQLPQHDVLVSLVDLFFKYVNSIFPLMHYDSLMASVEANTVPLPLLWSILAVGARFSDHPAIKTDPPYWAGEKYAKKAASYINAALMETSVTNLQFWAIMSCLEYGRAAGSRSWIYGGTACRMCFELGFHKKETESKPIYKKDGKLDKAAMGLRNRLYGSAGNSRPQVFVKGLYDTELAPRECYNLNAAKMNVTVSGKQVTIDTDSLTMVVQPYLSLVEIFGEVISSVQSTKDTSSKSYWPPLARFDELDATLQDWNRRLPDMMTYSESNFSYHLERASFGRLCYYLYSHVLWRTLVLVLHRSSLVYVDAMGNVIRINTMDHDTHRKIRASVDVCKQMVFEAMPIFEMIRTYCGTNVNPYMAYSSYMFATILMTSAFTCNEDLHRRGGQFLSSLVQMIDILRPCWPVCERLYITTRDLMIQHSKMYPYSENRYNSTPVKVATLPIGPVPITQISDITDPPVKRRMTSMSSASSTSSFSPPGIRGLQSPKPWTDPVPANDPSAAIPPWDRQKTHIPPIPHPLPSISTPANTLPAASALDLNDCAIDFNSSAFLNDTDLFGQLMFDETKMISMLSGNIYNANGPGTALPPFDNNNDDSEISLLFPQSNPALFGHQTHTPWPA